MIIATDTVPLPLFSIYTVALVAPPTTDDSGSSAALTQRNLDILRSETPQWAANNSSRLK